MIKSPSVKKMWQNCLALKKQFLKNYRFISKLKTGFAIGLFIFSIWVYWYFVNVSSTKWYFLKQQRQILWETKFQNEIVKIDVRKIEWKILSKDLLFSMNSSDPSSSKVLFLNSASELTMK